MKKYLVIALALTLCACSKSSDTTSNNIEGKWNATSRTVVYSANNKEVSRQSYTTTTAARTANTITAFYYTFDAAGNFGYYPYNLSTSTYVLFETGDKYSFSDPVLTLKTPTGGASTAVVTFTDSNNMMLTETYTGNYSIQSGGSTVTATTEVDLTYFTRN